MGRPSTIAIDGPAASGKSTVGALLAERLGFVYLDTGVMYRAVTWAAIERGVEIGDEAAVTALAEGLRIEVQRATVDDGRPYTVLADGEDVTWAIRSSEVEAGVSPVSTYAGVRAALTAQQRRIGAAGWVVMVGRDIGTVVLPEAGLKIFLTADLEERVRRRYCEMVARHGQADPERARRSVLERDEIDSQRACAPLAVAADAAVIDSTHMNVEEVLERILVLVKGRE